MHLQNIMFSEFRERKELIETYIFLIISSTALLIFLSISFYCARKCLKNAFAKEETLKQQKMAQALCDEEQGELTRPEKAPQPQPPTAAVAALPLSPSQVLCQDAAIVENLTKARSFDIDNDYVFYPKSKASSLFDIEIVTRV